MRAFFMCWMVVLASCGGGTGPGDDGLRVLFIGNSLTGDNDLPGLVEALGSHGGVRIVVGRSIQAGTSIEDQWEFGPARGLLAEGGWDFVVLQQGPSSLPASRTHLIEWTTVWAEAIRAEGAVPALYAVWPDEGRSDFFAAVSANYRAAADAVDGVFLPAGDAWLAAWAEDPDVELYGGDRFHPSTLGSLLAALTIYGGLTGTIPDVPSVLPGGASVGVSPTLEALLKRAAGAALDSR